jgi:hypothetical protein
MSRTFALAGLVAGLVLIAFGIGSIVIGANGRSEVSDTLRQEQIVGTPDMTPAAIRASAAKAGLEDVTLPTCSVAGRSIDTGSEAKCFASYMRVHALEATGGQVYSQMGRYLDDNGKVTDDAAAAAIDKKTGQPVENGLRNVWVNETALATALNTSFFAQSVALFSMVMGIALLLTGIGFTVITGTSLRRRASGAREGVSRSAAPAAA